MANYVVNFDKAFAHELALNTWIMYSIGVAFICLRFYAQVHRVGLAGLKSDDFLMAIVLMWYTILIVCLNIIAIGGGSNLFKPEEFSSFGPEEIQERIKGSKIVIVSEQAMLNCIYTVKACLLVLYGRFVTGTNGIRFVKGLSCYVIIGFIATEIAFFTACTPFSGYWAVPPPNPQCTTLEHYAIIQACFNISSDFIMLFIPLPMIIKLKLPLKNKVILGGVFSMGIFVITAAILTKVFNLSDVYDTSYMLWYTREASVAVYVSNVPLIWPLLREWIPYLRNATSYGQSTPLPTVENRRKRPNQERVISMDAFLKESAELASSKTWTETSEPNTPVRELTLDEKASSTDSRPTTSRSVSRGRSRTKTSPPEPLPQLQSTNDFARYSTESLWDGLITAETTIEVDELLVGEMSNSLEERQKYMCTPPPGRMFEALQANRSASREVTISGGVASSPSLSEKPPGQQ